MRKALIAFLVTGLAAGLLVAPASAGKKKKAFNKAWGLPETANVRLTPTLNANRNGGVAGLVLQF